MSRLNEYFIASIKNTCDHHDHISWWGWHGVGYRIAINEGVGRYCYGYAVDLNDGLDCIAVPVGAVMGILSAEPYFTRHDGKPARFYDTPGPAVEHNRSNWNWIIRHSLRDGRTSYPLPRLLRTPSIRSYSPIVAPS